MTKQKKYWKGLAELANDPLVDKLKENEFTEEEKSRILSKLAPVVEMCVMDPNILEQNINGNTIYVRAEGQVDPMILSSILGLE